VVLGNVGSVEDSAVAGDEDVVGVEDAGGAESALGAGSSGDSGCANAKPGRRASAITAAAARQALPEYTSKIRLRQLTVGWGGTVPVNGTQLVTCELHALWKSASGAEHELHKDESEVQGLPPSAATSAEPVSTLEPPSSPVLDSGVAASCVD
jgi:hypothetical protein